MLLPPYQSASATQRSFELQPGDFAGRVIAVTGATGGLGTQLCHALAAAGATVVMIARSEKRLDALYDALLAAGAPTPVQVPLAQDKAAETDYAELSGLLASELGGLDAMVHTAACSAAPMPLGDVSQADWARMFAVNVSAARLASLACLPLLRASSLASLVFLLDYKPNAYWGAYGVSKQALHALMSMLADETEGMRDGSGHPRLAVNGYDPGPMRTALRRKAFPGELENQSPQPSARLGPLLSLVARTDRLQTGTALYHD